MLESRSIVETSSLGLIALVEITNINIKVVIFTLLW